MKHLTLKRVETGEDGTFGTLSFKKKPFVVTLEREWLKNLVGKSCITAGTYDCKRVDSPRFGDTFEVTNVFGRSHILFHKGNLDDDSHGCILVAEEFGKLGNDDGVVRSTQGYGEFMRLLENDNEFKLTIENHF